MGDEDDDDGFCTAAAQLADEPVVANAQLPVARQVLGIGHQPLAGVVVSFEGEGGFANAP